MHRKRWNLIGVLYLGTRGNTNNKFPLVRIEPIINAFTAVEYFLGISGKRSDLTLGTRVPTALQWPHFVGSNKT